MWIIVLGSWGAVGLATLFGAMLAPALRVAVRMGYRDWLAPQRGALASLAIIVVLFVIDSLFNAMVNPIFIAAAGALAAYQPQGARVRRSAPARRPGRRFAPGPRLETTPRTGAGNR